MGEVDDALSRWALTWRVRGRGPNVNVVSKPPTYAPRLRGRGPNANVVSKPPTYVPRLVGGITTIEGLCRRVAGVSGVYGSNSPRLAVGAPDTVLKLQTTSAKNAENGVLWARWTLL